MRTVETHPSTWTASTPLQRLEAFYRGRHADPERSGAESRTAAAVADALARTGVEVVTGVGGTGVVGVLVNGPGPVVHLRAELDALPVSEATGLDYASTTPGLMHACGHDLHLTALVGTAQQLSASRSEWSGTVVLVAQPAEETLTGARAMIEDGLFERFPVPDVALAQHAAPLPLGVVAHGLTLTRASAQVRVVLPAEPGHSAVPGTQPDVADGVARASGLLRAAARGEGADWAVTSVRAGDCANVLPSQAVLLGSLRADDLPRVQRAVEAGRQALTSSWPSGATVSVTGAADAVPVDPELMVDLVTEHSRAFGASHVWGDYRSLAADDFAHYARSGDGGGPPVRLGYWMLGVLAPARAAAASPAPVAQVNHSDRFAPDVRAVRAAVVALTTAARCQLAAPSSPRLEGTPS